MFKMHLPLSIPTATSCMQFPIISHLGYSATFCLSASSLAYLFFTAVRVTFQKCRSDLIIPRLPMAIRIELKDTLAFLTKALSDVSPACIFSSPFLYFPLSYIQFQFLKYALLSTGAEPLHKLVPR